MSETKNHASDPVTVLVFKDGFSARTFQIPQRWFSRFGMILGVSVGLTLITALFAVRLYRLAHQGSPDRVKTLELELGELQLAYRALEAKNLTPAALVTGDPTTPAAAITPVPTAPVTTPPIPPTAMTVGAGRPLLFSALPASSTTPPPDRATLPFKLGALRAAWQGSSGSLRVSFNIQYVKTDGGSQQGRIVVLARGPELLMAHPPGALNLSGTDALINPTAGESFSVSRFREGRAEFTAARTRDSVREAEILIFGPDSQLILYERVVVEAKAERIGEAKAARSSSPKSAPAEAQTEAPASAPPVESSSPPAATESGAP